MKVVTKRQEGVLLALELDAEQADRLVRAVGTGAFADFGVVDAWVKSVGSPRIATSAALSPTKRTMTESATTVRSAATGLSATGIESLSMADDVTQAYSQLAHGDREAFTRFVEDFWPELVRSAGWKLDIRGVGDSVDVAQESLAEFWQRAERGKLPAIESREDVFRLLAVIVARDAVKRVTAERSQRPSPGRGRLRGAPDRELPAGACIELPEPGEEEVAEFRSLCDQLLEVLPEQGGLRAVGKAWLEGGNSAGQIKSLLHLKVSSSAVRRKIKTVLKIWRGELARMSQVGKAE